LRRFRLKTFEAGQSVTFLYSQYVVPGFNCILSVLIVLSAHDRSGCCRKRSDEAEEKRGANAEVIP